MIIIVKKKTFSQGFLRQRDIYCRVDIVCEECVLFPHSHHLLVLFNVIITYLLILYYHISSFIIITVKLIIRKWILFLLNVIVCSNPSTV
jgi:hypothetical protein